MTTKTESLVERLNTADWNALSPSGRAAARETRAEIERLERERDEAERRGVVSGLRQAGTYANGYDGIDPKSDWLTLSRFREWLVAKSCEIEDRAEARLTAPVGLETSADQWANWQRSAQMYADIGGNMPIPPAIVISVLNDLFTLSARLREAEEALEPFASAAEDWVEMGDTRPISEDGRPVVGDLRRAAAIRSRRDA